MTDDDLFAAFNDDDADEEEQSPLFQDVDDEFDRLRMSTARAGSTYEDSMEMVDQELDQPESSGFSLSGFTPGQRLVLAILLLLDIIAVGIGFLVVTGRL